LAEWPHRRCGRRSDALGDWIGAHTRAFAAIGGVPRLVVPDNAKVAVIKACLGGRSRRAGKIDMPDDSPVIKEIFIDARPEEIFSYLTESRKYLRWMGVSAELPPEAMSSTT
jgi:hypothetical protein